MAPWRFDRKHLFSLLEVAAHAGWDVAAGAQHRPLFLRLSARNTMARVMGETCDGLRRPGGRQAGNARVKTDSTVRGLIGNAGSDAACHECFARVR